MHETRQWTAPPESLELPAGEVQVWHLALPDAAPKQDWDLLDDEEIRRAKRFRVEEPRQRFVVARAALRRLLGAYLRRPPDSLALGYGVDGKPWLDGPEHIEFNVAHSGRTALFAFLRDAPVGVDVERIIPERDWPGIAARFFSTLEQEELNRVPESCRLEAFYVCWARKEAYIKATGHGMRSPLKRFAVTVAPDASPALLWNDWDPEEPARWSLYNTPPIPGHTACLVVCGELGRFRFFRFGGSVDRMLGVY